MSMIAAFTKDISKQQTTKLLLKHTSHVYIITGYIRNLTILHHKIFPLDVEFP